MEPGAVEVMERLRKGEEIDAKTLVTTQSCWRSWEPTLRRLSRFLRPFESERSRGGEMCWR